MVPQPMRWLFWLLCRVSSRDAANAAVGDLLDELADHGDAPIQRRPDVGVWVYRDADRCGWYLRRDRGGRRANARDRRTRRARRHTASHTSMCAGAYRHAPASGLAVGLPLAWWISRSFAAYLFQVTPADPSVYVGVAMLVGAVGLGAALLPARQAARTDPMITLRA